MCVHQSMTCAKMSHTLECTLVLTLRESGMYIATLSYLCRRLLCKLNLIMLVKMFKIFPSHRLMYSLVTISISIYIFPGISSMYTVFTSLCSGISSIFLSQSFFLLSTVPSTYSYFNLSLMFACCPFSSHPQPSSDVSSSLPAASSCACSAMSTFHCHRIV